MVLKPESIFDAMEAIWPEKSSKRKVVLLSAQGRKFTQRVARELALNEELAAAVVVDSVAHLLPGVVGNHESTVNESFEEPGMRDCLSGLVLPSFAGGKRRMCCWAGIMRRSGSGGSGPRGKRRRG
jgi:tRNA G37 N-methylase TrmD